MAAAGRYLEKLMKNLSLRRRGLLGAGLATLLLTACGKPTSLGEVHGINLEGSQLGKDFRLLDTEGVERSLADYRGKVVLMFFGFTQCPDVCPTALVRAAEVKEQLGADGERLQVLFVTVDPERDTPEVLKAYAQAFDPGFVGLYGDEARLRETAKEFKLFYQKVPTGDSYTMDHTALSYVYDTQGKIRLALRHDQTPEDYVADLRKVFALG